MAAEATVHFPVPVFKLALLIHLLNYLTEIRMLYNDCHPRTKMEANGLVRKAACDKQANPAAYSECTGGLN